jgi:NarL family two-component system response regulator LiaR
MKALLVDDHTMTNLGIASCLAETCRFDTVEKAVCLSEAQRLISESQALPDLIVLDISLGRENGLDLFPFLKKHCKKQKAKMPKVLICSMYEDLFHVQSALSLGAKGYISKAGTKSEMLHAVQSVMWGETYVSEGLLPQKLQDGYSRFTKRERELLHLIKQHKTNQEIAGELGISLRTVENHISNIYCKTGMSTREELLKI